MDIFDNNIYNDTDVVISHHDDACTLENIFKFLTQN